MAIVNQPCYCTREQVQRALDVKLAAYDNEKIDRAICSSADAVEALTQRKFYPQDATRKWDWPNFQYAYPWRVWLDNYELAAPATLVTTGSLLPSPIVIPQNAIIYQPVNEGPPFNRIELRRDMNFGFGNNSTPQLDISITGTFGYWTKTRPAGTAAAAIGSGDSSITVSDGVSVGAGDVLIVDSERMLVVDASYNDTGISFSGLQTASAKDNVVMVTDATKFALGETLLVDAEWILIVQILGNTMVVKRGWSGSVLAAHTGGTLWARRTLAVQRGQLGTTAASHAQGAPLAVSDVPGLVRQLAIGEAVVWLTQEPSAYGGSAQPSKSTIVNRGGFSVSESAIGAGLPDLRQRVLDSKFTRKLRTRAI